MLNEEDINTYTGALGRGFHYAWGGVAHLALCGVYYIPWEHYVSVDFGAAEIPLQF